MIEPSTATTNPACIALNGCMGAAWCDYCGRPMPVGTEARDRLALMIAQLRELLGQKRAA